MHKTAAEPAENAVRKYFVSALKAPASLAKDVPLDLVRPATQAPARSKIRDEYIVIFADSEGRDAIYSYANGLATAPEDYGIRPFIPEHLKGSQRILQEYAYSARQSYGKVKWNIKFDDRNNDLMIDIKFPSGTSWHNITIRQATEAKRIREEKEIEALKLSSQSSGPGQIAGERTKALLLQSNDNPNFTPLGEREQTSFLRGGSTAQSEAAASPGRQYETVSDSGEEEFEAAHE